MSRIRLFGYWLPVHDEAFVVIKADDEFKRKTSRPNEMWQG
ncbi:hypothetical protein [Paracoccus saliphilus]|uniref:Uncharacterized protein n=1 Tax=Paracoccus saliphilus TaxID=405559 RepID=A0AA45W6T3_9RHOB|nr:hypothetical protein [Paracoccus saliphilus]SIT04479.1 hypothetical protein SAMN05421772_1141 [Paracoccus saliphilus]